MRKSIPTGTQGVLRTTIPLLFVIFFGSALNAEKPRKVLESEIGRSVLIIGELGHPLGSVLDIRGVIQKAPVSAKPTTDNAVLRVSSVNGKPVKIKFLFPLNSIVRATSKMKAWKPQIGETWNLRVAEIGEFTGTPPRVVSEIYETPVSPIPYGFQTKLLVLKRTRSREQVE